MRQWISLVRMSYNLLPGVTFPTPGRGKLVFCASNHGQPSVFSFSHGSHVARLSTRTTILVLSPRCLVRHRFPRQSDLSLSSERETVKVIDSTRELRFSDTFPTPYSARNCDSKLFVEIERCEMKVVLLKNFLHYFNLKQGTVLIAVFQLFTSGFSMIFFVLALAHAMGIQEMVVRDTEDALEREALEDISSNHLNTRKMDMAHHNATEMVYTMYCGLVITVIHFISTILLLYGALTNNRYLMAPWMIVMMTLISGLTISLFLVEQDCPFIATLGGKADICERMIVLSLVTTSSYVWFVVYSIYKSLETKKGLTHVLHGAKKKPAIQNVQKPKAVQALADKPFEV